MATERETMGSSGTLSACQTEQTRARFQYGRESVANGPVRASLYIILSADLRRFRSSTGLLSAYFT